MKNVKFNQTSAGLYGVAHEGDELVLKNHLAAELEKLGIVKVLGDAEEEAEESIPSKGSVRFHDETNKEKAAKETEEPTKTKEKNEKAGPNAPKKK